MILLPKTPYHIGVEELLKQLGSTVNGLDQEEVSKKARTMVFIVIAFTQLFNVFNMRNLKGSVFNIGLFSNKWVNYALIASICIQVLIIEVPVFAELFNFRPVSLFEFILWILLSSLILWVSELYKSFQKVKS